MDVSARGDEIVTIPSRKGVEMDFEYEGFRYFMMSNGTYLRDKEAPIPPQDVLDRWHFEAKGRLVREITDKVKRELTAHEEKRQRSVNCDP